MTCEECVIVQSDFNAFLTGLRDNCADLVLTDPPYSISKKTGFKSVGKNGVDRFAVSMDFGEWDHTEIDLTSFCDKAYNALRSGGTAIVFYDVWKITKLSEAMMDAGFKQLRLIIWEKTNPVPLNSKVNYLTNSRETAILGVKGGKPTFHSQYDIGTYRYPIHRDGGKRLHPTQKPLQLTTDLILKHSNSGDLVIDPFLGSGTTAVACASNGRRFAGCDIDSRYIEVATRRLASD